MDDLEIAERQEKFRQCWSRIEGKRLSLEEARQAARSAVEKVDDQKLAWEVQLMTINNPKARISQQQNPLPVLSSVLPPELQDAED
jgi:hypothetical protein